jgi:small subunit ribosomal protein S17
MAANQEKATNDLGISSKEFRCVVTSDKMSKSRVGVVERIVKHATYGKYIRRRSKLMFHDEGNVSKIGDEVIVAQCRRLSSRKKFALVKVVSKAK